MTGRNLLRWACYVGMAALYIASVPWYRGGNGAVHEGEESLVLWLGLPDWAAVALLCYVGVALLNTVAWLCSDMPEDPAPLAETNANELPGSRL